MQSIPSFLKSKGGYAAAKQLRAAGFQTRTIRAGVEDGMISQ